MISCPNCGGNVKFDISSQQLACEYCHQLFDPYAFENKTSDAEEVQSYESDYEVTVFTCPQCGGEILSTDNAAAGFCSFCGASTILYSRISHEHRPNYIIPFKKTKDDCKQAYADMMKRAIFAPKELKDPKAIDSFRGIYMPYWAFYITQKGPVKFYGEKSYRGGNYVYTDHYQLTGDIDAYYKGISYDASSSFADNISEHLAPFDLKGMKAFTPGYLSGFYADTADVDASVYQQDAEDIATSQSVAKLYTVPAFKSVPPKITNNSNLLHTKTQGIDSAMLPVWFMSYRKNNRVAYATVNGQTGKVVADIPIDPKKYALGSLLLAIPIFFILAAFFTLLPTKLLTMSAVLAVITTIICTVELNSIVKKDTLLDDRGRLSKGAPELLAQAEQMRSVKRKYSTPRKGKASNPANLIPTIIICVVMFSIIQSLGIGLSQISAFSLIPWIVLLIAAAVTIGLGIQKTGKLTDRPSIAGYIVVGITMVISFLIALIHPVSDTYYYIGSILSLLAVTLSITDIIRYYNILSTRKLPQFDKQGGDDRA